MNNRYYTDKGLLSKGTCLNILDGTDGKFFMLIPTTDAPETKGAPSTQAKTVLTEGSISEVEGLQSNSQKTYTFNYHRDNIRQLKKYAGKPLTFLERNPDFTGEKFAGSFKFGRSAVSVDGIVQGQIFLTVSDSDEYPIDDVRDLIKQTAVITTPLPDVVVEKNKSNIITIETLPSDATVDAASSSDTVATAQISEGKLTITGVAVGTCLINLTVSKAGEATSYRSIAVEVTAASE